MKIEKLSFIEFLSLPDEIRTEYKTIYDKQNFEVDCKKWLYGEVKDVQYLLRKQVTYNTIISVVSTQIKEDLMQVDAHIVIGTFNGIVKSIQEVSEIETNALGSELKPLELLALEEVGGFESFSYLPELDRLANGDILKYDKIKKLKWDDCFSKLALDARQSQFNKKIAELTSNSKTS